MGVHEKVYLVDDDESIRELATRYLKRAGHEVIAEASSVPAALDGIGGAIKNGMTVAVIDGDLKSGKPGFTDGAEIAAGVRNQAPGTVVVSFTSQIGADYGDHNVSKLASPEVFKNLAKAITAIPRK